MGCRRPFSLAVAGQHRVIRACPSPLRRARRRSGRPVAAAAGLSLLRRSMTPPPLVLAALRFLSHLLPPLDPGWEAGARQRTGAWICESWICESTCRLSAEGPRLAYIASS